jgi:2,3-dihydroxybenzoate decarboxylase
MFSVDYPYASNRMGKAFLDRISLSQADMAKLAWQNATALLRLGPG